MATITEYEIREVLAQEFEKDGWPATAREIRENIGVAFYGAPSRQPAFNAMRRIYLRGRDDANSDAEASE